MENTHLFGSTQHRSPGIGRALVLGPLVWVEIARKAARRLAAASFGVSLLGSCFPAPLSHAAGTAESAPQLGIGYDFLDLSRVKGTRPAPMGDPVATPANPLYLRLEVLWGEVERRAGEYDWSVVDTVVDRFRANHHEPVLDLWGGTPVYSQDILRPPAATEEAAMMAWERFVRETARHFKGRVRYFQIGKTPNAQAIWGSADSVRSYAFLLKKSAPIIRSEAPGSLIVGGGLSGADGRWVEKLLAEGTVPYLDVVSFRPDPRKEIGPQCDLVLQAIQSKESSAALWVEAIPVQAAGAEAGQEIVKKLLTVFDRGASAAFFSLPFNDGAGTPDGGEFLVRTHSALPSGVGRVPSADRIVFQDDSGAPLSGVRIVSFYDPNEGVSTTGYWAEGQGAPASAAVRLTARRPGPPAVYDPVTGLQSQPRFEPAQGGAQGTVPLGTSPLFLVYREGVGANEPVEGSESLAVSAVRGITAEEVIAKYREFQATQDAVFLNDVADALITFHFRIAGSSRTIDVGMGGPYFFDPKGTAEWELRDYYLNGNKSKWKEFPELPFIQPEKVLTLPLDITFDRSYSYEYAGEDTVDGHACHVLAFEPLDAQKTLYRGKLWIDKTTWARVRVSSIQTKVELPFLSSEERTTYAPVKAPDGSDVWVVSRIDGQQIYSTAGVNLIVLREVTFQNHRINDPEYATKREQALRSDHQMLRDTDKGLRYLEKEPMGDRTVKEKVDTNQLFAVGGVLYDRSLKHAVPLAGVNYFDFDFLKAGIQTNLFFAGALMALNVTDPSIGKSGFDLGGDLYLTALKRLERDFREGEEIEERGIRRREQSIAFNLGRQIGNFVKLQSSYELAYQGYEADSDTDPSYIPPKDTLVHTALLSASFNRAGYDVSARASYSVRDTFAFWGDPCQKWNPAPPSFCTGTTPADQERRGLLAGEDFNPAARGYYRYQAGATKEFFLRSFQKLRFGFDLYGGADLDRNSRFAFDRFGASVAGFSGSGIRFDNGGILRGTYLFNIANLIRFEASLEQGRVTSHESGGGTTNHTGLGLSGNLLGPWKTIWQLEYGYALKSDVKPVQGDQEVMLVILKLF